MVLKRSRGYQDIEGTSTTTPTHSSSRQELPDGDSVFPQEIEMASVSVVPDGKILK